MLVRCKWSDTTELMRLYHDKEWGVAVHDDKKLFEFLLLDTFQAGLSWQTILNKRENFRNAFDDFDAAKIAAYKDNKKNALMQDAGIIRNKLKINATITNAQHFLRLQKEHGSFDKYIWQFTGGETIYNSWEDSKNVPATSPESDAMSKSLQKEGFKFVGSTICYAFMQATGMILDHTTDCFRYRAAE
ncbi:MAG: DNA-3-methyladenine glycosylase I [Bacteroidia bacterium]